MRPAIRVDGLSKLYRIGTRQQAYHTLRESISEACLAGWQRLRRSASRAAAALTTTRHGRPAAPPRGPTTDGAEGRPSQAPRREGDHFWALKDVSFEVQPGEVVGIIGRNGAGKSTLLKILSRITEPTDGRVELRGRVGSLLEVGTGFHPELTGRENIYLNGSLLGMSRREIERKFDEIVDFSGVEEFLDTPVKRYSSGMYVRLAFAVAAHLEPEILIVDEVLAVGDASFQKRCLAKMQSVAAHGRTVLLVSHNMTAITSLSHRVILVDSGQLIAVGPPQRIVSKYICQTSALSSGERSLVNSRRTVADPHIMATNIELRDSLERVSAIIPASDPFSVTVDVHSAHDLEGELGFTIKTQDGVPLFTSSTNDHGQLVHFRRGTSRFRCNVNPNYLRPGRYTIQVGITCVTCRDLIPEAITFDVAPDERSNENRLYALPGYLQFDFPWCVVRAS